MRLLRAFSAIGALVAVLAATCSMFVACSTDNTAPAGVGPSAEGHYADDEMSPESAQAAGETPSEPLDLREVKFDDGESVADYAARNGITAEIRALIPPSDATPAERKKKIIAAMLLRADLLMTRILWEVHGQNGLAYSWGQHNSGAFEPPPGRPATVCITPVQGLDCSGMVWSMARAAEIPVARTNSTGYGNPQTWNTALPKAWGLEMELVAAVTNGEESGPRGAKFENGDIIVWSRQHIGVIAFDPAAKVVQSNGHALTVFPDGGRPETTSCPENLDKNHGPRSVPLDAMLQYKPSDAGKPRAWNLGTFRVLRLKAATVLDCTKKCPKCCGGKLECDPSAPDDPVANSACGKTVCSCTGGLFAGDPCRCPVTNPGLACQCKPASDPPGACDPVSCP